MSIEESYWDRKHAKKEKKDNIASYKEEAEFYLSLQTESRVVKEL